MNKRLLTGTGLLIAALLFGAVNVVSNASLRSARFDLTEHNLYTLSEGSKNILQNLEEPITLRFYLSKKLATGLPGINSYASRVEEMLEEFEQIAGGNILLQVTDPEPFSEEEDRAVAFGLQGVPLDGGSTQFYFGLAGTSSTDDQDIISFFQPEREEYLEYDLTKLVYKLAHPQKQVVGLMSSLPMEGGPSPSLPIPQQRGGGPPWLILDQIKQVFDVRTIETDSSAIPEDVDVLMIVHPKALSASTQYAIDQFVLGGGRLLVFVDPFSEADQGIPNPMNPMAGKPQNSELDTLFDVWGLELVKGKVVGDLPLSKKVQIQQQARLKVVDYPIWIDLRKEHLNSEDIVTAQIPNVAMASAGLLNKKEKAETEFVPLIQSDEAAMQIETSRLSFMPDITSMLRTYRPEGKKFTMAARITGTVKTAFPEGKPPEEKKGGEIQGEDAKPDQETDSDLQAHLAESKEPINVIVVADTDFLQDRFWVQVQNFFGQRIGIPSAGNGSFVTNALDNLGGSNDLISVRGRAGYSRPFTLVKAIQQEAEHRFRQKEQALQDRLQATERKMQELQSKKQEGSALILSSEQQQEIDRFRQELVQVRKELRGVQHELVKNIESLEGWIKFFNIGFIPLVIGLAGVYISASRFRGGKGKK